MLYAKDQWDDFFRLFFFKRKKNVYLRFIYREFFFFSFFSHSNVTSFCDTEISIYMPICLLRGVTAIATKALAIEIATATRTEKKWEKSSNVRPAHGSDASQFVQSENHWIVHSSLSIGWTHFFFSSHLNSQPRWPV